MGCPPMGGAGICHHLPPREPQLDPCVLAWVLCHRMEQKTELLGRRWLAAWRGPQTGQPGRTLGWLQWHGLGQQAKVRVIRSHPDAPSLCEAHGARARAKAHRFRTTETPGHGLSGSPTACAHPDPEGCHTSVFLGLTALWAGAWARLEFRECLWARQMETLLPRLLESKQTQDGVPTHRPSEAGGCVLRAMGWLLARGQPLCASAAAGTATGASGASPGISGAETPAASRSVVWPRPQQGGPR